MTPRRVGPVPTKHLDRYRHIAGVLADEGLHAVVDGTGLRSLAPKRRTAAAREDRLTPEQHVRQAIEKLGVTFIKVGQAASTRTDVIPPRLAEELRKLQDEVTPEPFATVKDVVERELEQPLEQAFASFDPEPMAAASIGQVHRATLPDGTAVAVKVQRPGVREQVDVDLDIALTQSRWAAEHAEMLRDIDVVALAEEFADAVRGELDYVREARNAERLRRAFKDDEGVVFPRVHWSHTTSRVLTLDMIDGVRMNRMDELDAAGFDRAVLANRGIQCYLRQIFEMGFFHADPHSGNYLAIEGNRVAFTDFGRVGSLSDESRERFTDLLWAAVNRDAELATDTFLAMASNQKIDEAALQKEVTRLIGKYHGRELGRIDPAELFGEVLGLIRDHRLGVSSDFALAIATLGLLEGVGTMLDPEFDFASVAAPVTERIIRERSHPDELLQRFVRGWRRSGRVLESMPGTVDRLMRRLSRGDLRVSVAPRDYQDLVESLHELVNRLAFAIIVAALVIGFSTLIGAEIAPMWMRTVGEIGMILAFGVSVWFFGSIIWTHYRGRRIRR